MGGEKWFFALIFVLLLLFGGRAFGGEKVLRAGVASMITPVSAVKYYQQVVAYLGERLGMKSEMIHRTTYDEIDHLLKEEGLDVAFICAAPYVLDHQEFGVELLVAPEVGGKPWYQSYIIVHRQSAIRSFEDLAGQSFVFVDPKSNSGRLYPLYWLGKQGKSPDTFFSRYLFSYSHNKSVEMVAKHKVAGAAVDSNVYEYMAATGNPYAGETKIIHRSPWFGIPPVVVPGSLPLFMKEKMKEILLVMHEDADGREILKAMRIDRFVEVPDSNYNAIREMLTFTGKISSTVDGGDSPVRKQEDRVINFTVIPRDNPRMAYDRYQPLVDYLSKNTGLRFELLLKKNYRETVDSLGHGEAWFGILGPLTYLDAYVRFNTPPIAKSKTANGDPFYYSVIITSQNSTISLVDELNGKKFAFAALWSTSGNLIPRYMLARQGIHLDALKDYHNYNYHDTVVKEVVSGAYDAGVVRKPIAEKYLALGLKILATSDPIPTGPVVISPVTPYGVVQKVQKVLLGMSENEAGRAVLQKLDFDLRGGFVAASDADYTGIRKMINDVPTTCGMGCHPKTTF